MAILLVLLTMRRPARTKLLLETMKFDLFETCLGCGFCGTLGTLGTLGTGLKKCWNNLGTLLGPTREGLPVLVCAPCVATPIMAGVPCLMTGMKLGNRVGMVGVISVSMTVTRMAANRDPEATLLLPPVDYSLTWYVG